MIRDRPVLFWYLLIVTSISLGLQVYEVIR